jgi:mRNA interferase RelE/StbE
VYEVFLEKSTQRDLRSLSGADFHRIIPRIKKLAQNPRPSGCHKIAGSKSDWRIRVGDYRVIYEVDDNAKVVRVMRVKHRREAYR